MTTKLTYKQLIDICNARRTDHIWFINTINNCKVAFSYDDCNHDMHVTVGGLACISFDKCRLNAFTENVVDLYKKDAFIGCIDIKDLEAWE